MSSTTHLATGGPQYHSSTSTFQNPSLVLMSMRVRRGTLSCVSRRIFTHDAQKRMETEFAGHALVVSYSPKLSQCVPASRANGKPTPMTWFVECSTRAFRFTLSTLSTTTREVHPRTEEVSCPTKYAPMTTSVRLETVGYVSKLQINCEITASKVSVPSDLQPSLSLSLSQIC